MRYPPSTVSKVGYFVFSLDTELAWGGLWNQPESKDAWRHGALERQTIQRLLDLMDEFGIVSTWAITGHLFYDRCEECKTCPILELKGHDRRFDQIWGTQDSRWYGADVVDALVSRKAGHEIGFHGYTHRVFDELSKDDARFEIQEWLRLANRRGIVPQTVIFPQGRIAHLDLFRDAGFICYRGRDVRHPALAMPVLGKVLNRINHRMTIFTPLVHDLTADHLGLVNIPSSQWLFRINRRIEMFLDSLNLDTLRLLPTLRSIDRAAAQRRVVHLWVHPHEFQTDKDFAKLRFVFARFAEQARAGRLESITMSDLAKQTLAASTG